MQTVKLIVLGKLKERYLTDACNEYIKRLSAFCKLELIELEPVKLPDNAGEVLIEKALTQEAQKILQKAQGTEIVALCIEGTQISSEKLSSTIEDFANRGASSISFVIGSSYGLSAEVKSKAALKLSMSKMTFPHQLARVMLLEQIYRAFQISNNSKYHK